MFSIFFVYFIFVLAASSLSDAAKNSRKAKERALPESSKGSFYYIFCYNYFSEKQMFILQSSYFILKSNFLNLLLTIFYDQFWYY